MSFYLSGFILKTEPVLSADGWHLFSVNNASM